MRSWKSANIMEKEVHNKSKMNINLVHNEYLSIRTEEEENCEVIIDKCGDDPKSFSRYTNLKLKHGEDIGRLWNENIIYEDLKETSKILKIYF